MKTTDCPTCSGIGWVTDENDDDIVCPACSGVGKASTPTPTAPARVARPPVLARFAGSLTGDPGKWSEDQMAGGTVIREEPCPANQLPKKP